MTEAPPPEPDTGPYTVPVRPTGHGRVDAVLDRAAELDVADVAEHPRLYDELHTALAAELEAEPGTVPPGLVPPPDSGPR